MQEHFLKKKLRSDCPQGVLILMIYTRRSHEGLYYGQRTINLIYYFIANPEHIFGSSEILPLTTRPKLLNEDIAFNAS